MAREKIWKQKERSCMSFWNIQLKTCCFDQHWMIFQIKWKTGSVWCFSVRHCPQTWISILDTAVCKEFVLSRVKLYISLVAIIFKQNDVCFRSTRFEPGPWLVLGSCHKLPRLFGAVHPLGDDTMKFVTLLCECNTSNVNFVIWTGMIWKPVVHTGVFVSGLPLPGCRCDGTIGMQSSQDGLHWNAISNFVTRLHPAERENISDKYDCTNQAKNRLWGPKPYG